MQRYGFIFNADKFSTQLRSKKCNLVVPKIPYFIPKILCAKNETYSRKNY